MNLWGRGGTAAQILFILFSTAKLRDQKLMPEGSAVAAASCRLLLPSAAASLLLLPAIVAVRYHQLGVLLLGVWPLGIMALGKEWAGERPDKVSALRSLRSRWHYFRVSAVMKPSAYGHGRGGGAWSVVSPPLG